ncbi:MAG TPA: DNA-processing protein DprA [Gemmataceae bacterium]|nr:DNA-processing protein DprA [Gemmataceae bacterium]
MPDTPDIPDSVRPHLALALVPGLGPKLTAAVLRTFGSADAALRATAGQLLEIPHIGEKVAASLAAALRTVDVEPELRLLEAHGVRPVPLGFPGYPAPLAGLSNPPPLLYFRGELTEAGAGAVAIVGSRSCTAYGKRVAEQIARGLVRAGLTVVSGLARGIDGAAHRGALDAGGRTVAVLAGGLSEIYPPEHADLAAEIAAGRGCLVSETPMTVAPQPGMFPARNRIISGLSRAVVVIEANAKSGALITARHALEQGREVFAVPGNVDSPASAGCLELLRHGATLVRSADDVLDDLKGIATAEYPTTPASGARPDPRDRRATERGRDDGREPLVGTNNQSETKTEQGADAPRSPEPIPPPDLDPVQRRVFELLASRRHGDELSREAGLGVAELSRVLMQLEMKRLVRRLPGNFYERR